VAISDKVAQNKRQPGSSFKFIMQRFEMSRNNARMHQKIKSLIHYQASRQLAKLTHGMKAQA